MSTSYRPPKSTPLVNFNDVRPYFNEEDLASFNAYLCDYNGYIEKVLHDIKGNKTKKKEHKDKISRFDYLFSLLKVPKNIMLNILLVENEPESIKPALEMLKGHFSGLNFFLVAKSSELAKGIRKGEVDISAYVESADYPFENTMQDTLKLDQIDLVLQDIFLGADSLSGSEITNLYFDVAPQAMVFFLTSMDIETLAASGYDKKVDRLISKDRIQGLVKYYHDRFDELYGPLLWPVFAMANDRDGDASLVDRTSLRRLLGNIRSWTVEPKILFHGFALPEMVDHEFRHTRGLWNMANKILGPFLERRPSAMSYEDRVLLSLAIWLHDIGHRGDEHHYESIEIRENHGSISESIMLSYYDSLGIAWLKDFCSCPVKDYNCDCGVFHRNKKDGCHNEKICPLRKVGLVCRYHQSTAPLKGHKLAKLILKMKRPSPYCIIGMEDFNNEIPDSNYKKQIDTWLDTTKDFGWFSFDIRTLDEFNNDGLINLAGLLRWLDALHTHNEKVGSSTQLKSFLAYLKMRKDYCEKKEGEIKDLLDNTDAGTEAYLTLVAELMKLDSYSQLLDVQWIHLWRSAAVKDIRGEWFWDEKGCWVFGVVFDLFEKDPLEAFDEMRKVKKELTEALKKGIIDFHELWKEHVLDEVIISEIKSQIEDKEEDGEIIQLPPYFEHYFKGVELSYWYKSGDSDPKKMTIKTAEKAKEPLPSLEDNGAIKRNKGLILDCDPGCDDALALLLCVRSNKSPYDEIHICTVAGNIPVDRTTHNAKKIATAAIYRLEKKPSITIRKGSAVSFMGKSPNVTSVHGRDGLGEVPSKIYQSVNEGNEHDIKMEEKKSAVEFLKDFKGDPNGKKYDLVCTGPLTNIATALSLSREPEKLLNMFDKIIIMGGVFHYNGNITPTAEFNFFFDPVAVQILLDTIKKYADKITASIVFVPLDITERAQLNMKEIDEDKSIEHPVGQWTLCMLQKYFYFHSLSARELEEKCAQHKCDHPGEVCMFTKETYKDIRNKIKMANLIGKSGLKQMPRFCYLHDPLAVWYAIKSDDCQLKEAYIKIHTDNDEMRGTIIVLDDKDSKLYTKGTKVQYLSPSNVSKYIEDFKKDLLFACGLHKKKPLEIL